MPFTIRTRYVAILSLFVTYLFFIEYTPLHRRVHIPFDLEGYHYPLFDYAFEAIHQGRFPQWDPTIYCGLTFPGNTQAALFYPPAWLVFAANWGRPKVSYQSVEDLDLAHVWLAFFLCYVWLRHQRALHPLAAAFGGGIFAFSGFMLQQLQHFGFVAGYAWIPIGWAGIDAIDQQGSWRPIWRTVLASAMCFLAGYPSMWVVFAIYMIVYAGVRKGGLRRSLIVAGALLASLIVAAVQVLPAWEAAQLMFKEPKYGTVSGMKDPDFFISYFVPNYFDFGLNVPIQTNPGRDYLYLGGAAFVGLALLPCRKRFKDAGPPLAVLLVSLLFFVNPFGLLGGIVERFDFLADILSAYYFIAGLTASVALLAALGLDYGLRRPAGPAPPWLAAAAIAASLAWSIRLLVMWFGEGKGLSIKWMSGVDTLAAVILFGLLIAVFPGSSRRFRFGAAAAAIVLVAAEYKAFGSSKRFNASRQPFVGQHAEPFPGLNTAIYHSLRERPEYRLALDATAPFSLELRPLGLTTPQGFDPFLPQQYRKLIDPLVHFETNRLFTPQPENVEALRLLGIGYFITSEAGPLYPRLVSNPRFRMIDPRGSYYRVFEFADAQPSFAWDGAGSARQVEVKAWQPETRAFALKSTAGGGFRLTEQFFPGWTATIDKGLTPIERCHEAFQCVAVPPGTHIVEFRYHSRFLIAGALISVCSILCWVALAAKPLRGAGRMEKIE